MGLTRDQEARRHALGKAGYTGSTNAELDALNRLKTNSQSDADLLERIRSHPEKCGQAKAALRERGVDYD